MKRPVTKKKDIKCPECGVGSFKSEQGLAGHRKISHNVQPKTIEKSEIIKHLEILQVQLASTIDPKKAIKTEKDTVVALQLLLPAIEKYGLAVCSLPKDESTGFWSKDITKYRIVKNAQICNASLLGSAHIADS